MPISFDQISNSIRTPFVTAEFDNSQADQGDALLPYRVLLIGQRMPSGSAVIDTPVRVTSADQVAQICGRGSMLHRMAKAYFALNKSTETWLGVLGGSSAGILATGSFTVTGPATAAGTVVLYIGGDRIEVAVANADSANTIAGNIATAIGKHAAGTVTLNGAVAGTNITIGTTTFVGTVGGVVLGAATYSVDTSNNAAAASLVAQVHGHATAGKLVRASAASAVVTFRDIAGGAAGNSIPLSSTDGAKAAVSAATLLGATPTATDLPVHASVSGAVVTTYAKNTGLVANELDMRLNYNDGETLPAGVGVAVGAMSGGASNPTLDNLIAHLGDVWYQLMANPYTDATSLGTLEAELADRFGPSRMIDGFSFTGKNDTYSNVATLGESRNSQHNAILRVNDRPTQSCEIAAATAAVVAIAGSIDPARPFQTLPLTGVKQAMPPSVRDTQDERNLLLFDGVSTLVDAAGGVVRIERLITTYQTNAAGSPDPSYLDVNTMLTLMYLRYSFRNMWSNKYPRHKLGDDGTKFGAGQPVVTPSIGRAEAISWFSDMEELGLVEDLASFKANLVVERNATDVNRLDFLLPPNLINQLIVTAAQIQFRL